MRTETIMNIRRLRPSDGPAFVALRVAALRQEPLAFASSLSDDHAFSLEVVRNALAGADEQAVYGYFDGGELGGIAGVARASKLKHRHKAEVWGMYVPRELRRRGIGRSLLHAIIAHVRGWQGVGQLHVGVTAAATAAQQLFEGEGFRSWGREPRALQNDGTFVDEFHMILDLGPEVAVC
jgi:ribosomal protein S18 acetylase RimI-like enzyme